MKNIVKMLSLVLISTLLLLVITACVNNFHNDESSNLVDTNKDTEKAGSQSTDETDKDPSEITEHILADLNGDGTEDKILIEFGNKENTIATIKIFDGTNNTELMSESLSLGANKVGAYYLKAGKNNYPDEIVMWHYAYLDNGKLEFHCSSFTFEPNGKKMYGIQESKVFDIGPNASIASGNIPFGALIDTINENIRANDAEYNAYLLLDNQGETILASTEDNLLAPSELSFTLEHFANQSEGNPGDNTDWPDNNNSHSSTEMVIEEGYTVISSNTLTVPVTIDKVKVNHTARVAALRNAEGNNALYLDVLSADNKVITSITWKGCYQLFINDEGVLILLRLSILPANQRGTISYVLYEISDTKFSNYDIIELESPQINPVAGEGKNLTFAVGSPAALGMYEYHFLDFAYSFQDALKREIKDGHDIYMIADCYLNPTTPTVYSDTEKVPSPDFEDKNIIDKYTLTYAASLFE